MLPDPPSTAHDTPSLLLPSIYTTTPIFNTSHARATSTSLLVFHGDAEWRVTRPPSTAVQSLLDDACARFFLPPLDYQLELHQGLTTTRLNHSTTLRLSALPHNAHLHLRHCPLRSTDVHVTVELASEDGLKLSHTFPLTASLHDVLITLESLHPSLHPTAHTGVPASLLLRSVHGPGITSMPTTSRPHPPSRGPTSPASPLCVALPAPVQHRIDAFLGFSVLMDLRVLSRDMRRRSEEAALRWMTTHLSAEGLQHRDEARSRRRNAARISLASEFDHCIDGEDKPGDREIGSDDEPTVEPTVDAAAALDPDVSDAVWLRRQLDRWGHCSRDPVLCVISPSEAQAAYDRQQLGKCAPISLWDQGVVGFRVIDLAQELFRKYKHAAAIEEAVRPEERKRTLRYHPADDRPRLAAERQAVRTAAARWKASSTGAAWLLQLPADVLAHSVLGFLDFGQLMGARAVSRGMQRAAERGACAWMNRTFPAGLQRLVDEQQVARVDAQAQQAVAGKKKSRQKRKRAMEEDDEQHTGGWRGLSGQRDAPPSPSSAPLSSTSSWAGCSPMAPSASAAVSGVSFNLSDCVWALQQLLWAQRLDDKAMRGIRHQPDACYRGTVRMVHALPRFCLRSAQLPACVQRVPNATALTARRGRAGTGVVYKRFEILPLLDAAFGAYGHASALLAIRARRADIAAKRASTSGGNRDALLGTVKVAFAQAGAWWRLGGSGRWVQVDTRVGAFLWGRRSGWEYSDPTRNSVRLHDSEQKRTEYHREGARVHAAVTALGWHCKGRCGWGDCAPRVDGIVTAAQLARQRDDGIIEWTDKFGFEWYAYRLHNDIWEAHKRGVFL